MGLGATQLKRQSEGSGLGVAPLAVEVFAPAGFFLPLRVCVRVYVCVCVRVCVRARARRGGGGVRERLKVRLQGQVSASWDKCQ